MLRSNGQRGRHLRGGSHAIVNGSLAGVTAQFEIDVLRVVEAGLDLQASGPIDFEVTYRVVPQRGGVIVEAEVKLGRETALNAHVGQPD